MFSCCFPEIANFSNNLKIEAHVLAVETTTAKSYDKVSGRVYISCHSLSKWQKYGAWTLCALAIITLLVGISSIAGAHFVGKNAAFAMVYTGLSVLVVVVSVISIIHFLFERKVANYLKYASQVLWCNANAYPGNAKLKELDECEKVSGQFIVRTGSEPLFGKRYHVLNNGLVFHIEYHRTKTIHNERE